MKLLVKQTTYLDWGGGGAWGGCSRESGAWSY